MKLNRLVGCTLLVARYSSLSSSIWPWRFSAKYAPEQYCIVYHCCAISAQSFSRYHPSKGYWWQFKDGAETGRWDFSHIFKNCPLSSVYKWFDSNVYISVLWRLKLKPRPPSEWVIGRVPISSSSVLGQTWSTMGPVRCMVCLFTNQLKTIPNETLD